MNYRFQIRAATKAKAKKAVEARLATEGFTPDRERGLALAAAHIDALPDPSKDLDLLVVLNGDWKTAPDHPLTDADAGGGMAAASASLTEISGACSVYLVPKDAGDAEPEPAPTTTPTPTAAPTAQPAAKDDKAA